MNQHLVYPLRLLLALGAFCHCSGETPSPSNGAAAGVGDSLGMGGTESSSLPKTPRR